VLEDPKVYRLLMGLNAPRDGVAGADFDPSDKVGLYINKEWLDCARQRVEMGTYLAMNLQFLHGRHDCARVEGEMEGSCRKCVRGVAAEGGKRNKAERTTSIDLQPYMNIISIYHINLI